MAGSTHHDNSTRTISVPAETADWLLRLAASVTAGSALRYAHGRLLAEQVALIFGPAEADPDRGGTASHDA